MAILVTGGAGYLGTHICVELLMAGYEVIILDNFSNSSPIAVNRVMELTGKQVKLYKADVENEASLIEIFSNEKIDAVIHLAGYKSVSESTAYPLRYYANNIAGTITLCSVMQNFNVKQLVFSSSATVYRPTSRGEPISENHPLGATTPYGQSKQMVEEILQHVYEADQSWSICILRYFNPVGAHESGLIGEDPKDIPNNLFPYITNVAVGNLPTLFIYGNDYPTRDGTGVRDYIHVVDLALGHVSALKKVVEESGRFVFNLGTGEGYSVLEVVQAFEQASGRNLPYVFAPRRKGDVALCYADVSKAKRELGWEAKKGIDEMCRDAWQWQQLNPKGYRLESIR